MRTKSIGYRIPRGGCGNDRTQAKMLPAWGWDPDGDLPGGALGGGLSVRSSEGLHVREGVCWGPPRSGSGWCYSACLGPSSYPCGIEGSMAEERKSGLSGRLAQSQQGRMLRQDGEFNVQRVGQGVLGIDQRLPQAAESVVAAVFWDDPGHLYGTECRVCRLVPRLWSRGNFRSERPRTISFRPAVLQR